MTKSQHPVPPPGGARTWDHSAPNGAVPFIAKNGNLRDIIIIQSTYYLLLCADFRFSSS